MTGIGLTWDQVRARSEVGRCYCFACWLHFEAGKVPCLKHTLPDEVAARDQVIAAISHCGAPAGAGRGRDE